MRRNEQEKGPGATRGRECVAHLQDSLRRASCLKWTDQTLNTFDDSFQTRALQFCIFLADPGSSSLFVGALNQEMYQTFPVSAS